MTLHEHRFRAEEGQTRSGDSVAAPSAVAAGRPWSVASFLLRLAGGLLLLFLGLIAGMAIFLDFDFPLQPLPRQEIALMSNEGAYYAAIGQRKLEPVTAAELPEHVASAFAAAEDRRFYEHHGVSLRGMARAAWVDLKCLCIDEGGSTIPMQVMKNGFFSGLPSFARKLLEIPGAIALDLRRSKADIMANYVSSIYFGEGQYGLRAAAQYFFSESVSSLTVSEAALLAAAVNQPGRFRPGDHDWAWRRAQRILDTMVEIGAITDTQRRQARRPRMRISPGRLPAGGWFADWIAARARGQVDRPSYGRVTIQTTLDTTLQSAAERSIAAELAPHRFRNLDVAFVAMRPDGAVVAMVGGRRYPMDGVRVANRAIHSRRPAASTFKLFVLLAGLRDGMTLAGQVRDAPLAIGDWSPRNFDGRFLGSMTLEQAFARSRNVPFVIVAQDAGLGSVRRAARDLGIAEAQGADYTEALGTTAVSLLDLAAAYASVAQGRFPVVPYGLRLPVPQWARGASGVGEVLAHRFELCRALSAVVTYGTGRAAATPLATYGKTGTSDGNRDAYFIGFVGNLVVGVRVSKDDGSSMQGVTGGGIPARIFSRFVNRALKAGEVQPSLCGQS